MGCNKRKADGIIQLLHSVEVQIQK